MKRKYIKFFEKKERRLNGINAKLKTSLIMKKRRGLKRYYRKLHRQDFTKRWNDILSDNETWFNLAHQHFDWWGYGDISWKEHKEHLDVLFKHFTMIETQLKSIKRPI